jgi:hypothetical protein
MPDRMARSPDRTSFSTAETPEALRSPSITCREPRRLLSIHAVPEFIWRMSVGGDNQRTLVSTDGV